MSHDVTMAPWPHGPGLRGRLGGLPGLERDSEW